MNRLVVVSNRVPSSTAGTQAGGLAVALEGLMAKRGGMWFGWSGDVSEDAPSRPPTVMRRDQVDFCTLDLTQREHDRYYSNYSNGVLWPLLHTMPELIAFDRKDALVYREVNTRFSDALFPLVRPNDLIWIHDYHLMALPAQLRARGLHNPIGFFLHIPFPSADVLSMVPEATSLIKDLLHADLIGFQTEKDAENFAAAAQVYGGAVGFDDGWLHIGSRRVRIGVFPVEIDPRAFSDMARIAWRAAPTERLRRSLNGQKLILGVDRLDPTKGLVQRLNGFRRLLETREHWRRRATLLQIAAVSRQDVTSYRDLRIELDQTAGSINSSYGDPDWTPLRIVARAGARDVVAGYMREARIGLVTPLRDGMNLVAKEYVASQDPQDPGVLILSRFAGAARQLDAALLVNPHDPDDMADALDKALQMPLAERQTRWNGLWGNIANTSPLEWGRSFLASLLRAALVADAPQIRPRLRPERQSDPMGMSRPKREAPIGPGSRQVN